VCSHDDTHVTFVPFSCTLAYFGVFSDMACVLPSTLASFTNVPMRVPALSAHVNVQGSGKLDIGASISADPLGRVSHHHQSCSPMQNNLFPFAFNLSRLHRDE
jgi:hypothetical protein